MLIIFDLDDTLIDTSGCLTPVKLERALSRMVTEGLALESFDEALALLLRLDTRAESARQALEEFIEINGFDEKFLKGALEEVYGIFSDDLPIFPMEDAREVLEELHEDHRLALVSMGNPDYQRRKLEKAGIDSSLFCKILISGERDKKKQYELLLAEYGYPPKEVIVCGDRIFLDLVPAKQLGCTTVHMKRGRGVHGRGREGWVDFTVTRLFEIRNIILNMTTFMGNR